MADAFVMRADEGRTLDMGTFEAVVIEDGARTSGDLAVLRTQREPQGFGPPMHVHHDAAEAFYVIEGTYLMYLEDRQERCPPGSFVYVPREVPHTFTVLSEQPGVKLNLFTPAAMIGFFEEMADGASRGDLVPAQVELIARRHAMEVVGPVPDSYV